ncbi:hypothetical protein [Buttiauxella izardii]|uniref:hypothetical protein n=1 Tax=Buttiauxella izardii TaxID=82991 RepID=UPI0011C241A7|nr:hypothetical protein [Buttiauxella izardii]
MDGFGTGFGDYCRGIESAGSYLPREDAEGYIHNAETMHNVYNLLGGIYLEGGKGFPQDYQQSYAWYAVAVANGSHKAKEMRERVVKKLTDEELKQAKLIAETYIKKYPSPLDENDTNKSNTDCKYP